jgi:hypothetical protein
MEMLLPLLVPLVALIVCAVSPGIAFAAPATTMRLGFLDGGFFDPAVQLQRLREAADLGSRIVRVPSGWSGIAPRKPANPADPADPAYQWTSTDAAIRAASAAGLEPLLSFTGAPDWAEGPNRPDGVNPGTWRPDPIAYGRFAQALARRYDGTYPDPLRRGAALPRVRSFLPWNEPNLATYLTPQWRRTARGFVAEAPSLYRRLVRAFNDGIHARRNDALVVAGALAPFGDLRRGGRRIAPARFLRDMLCLDRRLRRVKCGAAGAPRFDVLSHHPYSVGGPFRRALNADDVSVPDIAPKLLPPLRRAERLGILGSAKRSRRVWVTEIAWDSAPPDPDGVPARRHANWLAESMYLLARQGVDTVTWFQVRDQRPGEGGYDASSQSGVLFADGRPKIAATAFRFPLVAIRRRSHTVLWALAPGDGELVVERRTASGWTSVFRRSGARRGQVVTGKARLARGVRVRARQGSSRSLSVRVSAAR